MLRVYLLTTLIISASRACSDKASEEDFPSSRLFLVAFAICRALDRAIVTPDLRKKMCKLSELAKRIKPEAKVRRSQVYVGSKAASLLSHGLLKRMLGLDSEVQLSS